MTTLETTVRTILAEQLPGLDVPVSLRGIAVLLKEDKRLDMWSVEDVCEALVEEPVEINEDQGDE